MASSISCTPLFFSALPTRIGTSRPLDGRGSQPGSQLIRSQHIVLEVAHHQLLVGLRDQLDQMVTSGPGLLRHSGRNLGPLDVLAQLVVEHVRDFIESGR